MRTSTPLGVLACARRVASHAESLGVDVIENGARPASGHFGAVLADSTLQAGLNYRTVVRPRVDRIERRFPIAAKLSGVKAIVQEGLTANFLLWNHPTKLTRFVLLVNLFDENCLEDACDLRDWLSLRGSRDQILALQGIGPKTYDYMCCLVGIDRIAVDRHVRTFANSAGVPVSNYDDLQAVVSYAADLLGLQRRDFDAWIWHHVAETPQQPPSDDTE